jgi:large subunit ribosomal protein L4
MASIDVKDADGKKAGTATLEDEWFGIEPNVPVMHQVVTAQLAARRAGSHSTRTRAEVRGGGAKPWRQKGTGRARAGSIRSPLWAGGGAVFGPTPRHYTVKVNRKARRAALRSALSLHAERGSIAVVDAGAFDTPSAKQAAQALAKWGAPQPTLVALADDEVAAAKSFRNLDRASVLPADGVGVADLLGAASLVVSEAALTALTARANGKRSHEAAASTEEPA